MYKYPVVTGQPIPPDNPPPLFSIDSATRHASFKLIYFHLFLYMERSPTFVPDIPYMIYSKRANIIHQSSRHYHYQVLYNISFL